MSRNVGVDKFYPNKCVRSYFPPEVPSILYHSSSQSVVPRLPTNNIKQEAVRNASL